MSKGLIPGYKFVEEFSEEFETGFEEEVSLVTLDLGQADLSIIPNADSYRLIGLDTPTPFLQLGGNIFKGCYETLLGSEILFKESSEHSQKMIAPHGIMSERRVRFNQLVLKSPEEMEEEAREKENQTFAGAESVEDGTALGRKQAHMSTAMGAK
ncbi:uncharacterized protein EI90DRAFT_3124013 [Cantharellus anzutake]|uniref:uncharacterized protein n=1 Tax=Cantharellus anzutake TaxID=1750568 RepID=UPI001905A505|nr:uncharacterized protein EI90DRAFT_3124013 [Cantharellus anzutake]KAF8330795.1 hypothetical protein EI90DRAFT_3124013 [Cantharellus anzutake]